MILTAALCVAGALTAAPAPPDPPPEKIVYTSTQWGNPAAAIYIMSADGAKPTKLSKDGAIEFDPALSADGKHIVFVAMSLDDIKTDLWTMDADGSNRRQLTQNPAKTIVMNPAWSPDGKHLAFARTAVDFTQPTDTLALDADIVRMDADGQKEWAVAMGAWPVWSPDGKRILYTQTTKTVPSEPRVGIMDADGQNAKQLVNIPSMMAAYSPDGRRITFVGAPNAKSTAVHVYVASADGSGAVQASKETEGSELAPHWSADGKRIYFSRSPKISSSQWSKILVMDADGNNEEELTKDGAVGILGGAGAFMLGR